MGPIYMDHTNTSSVSVYVITITYVISLLGYISKAYELRSMYLFTSSLSRIYFHYVILTSVFCQTDLGIHN